MSTTVTLAGADEAGGLWRTLLTTLADFNVLRGVSLGCGRVLRLFRPRREKLIPERMLAFW